MNVAVDVYSDNVLDAKIAQLELALIFSKPWDMTQLPDDTWCISGVVAEPPDAVMALLDERISCNAQSFVIESADGGRLGWTSTCRQ